MPGGAGNAVSEVLRDALSSVPLLNIGLPDRFIDQGSREEVLTDAGLDAPGIEAAIRAFQARLERNVQ